MNHFFSSLDTILLAALDDKLLEVSWKEALRIETGKEMEGLTSCAGS